MCGCLCVMLVRMCGVCVCAHMPVCLLWTFYRPLSLWVFSLFQVTSCRIAALSQVGFWK